MEWLFPQNDLGQDSGLHDAGVETFKGNYYRYLARETIQNSLDARDPGKDTTHPVIVKFERLEIKRDRIPDIDGFCDTLARCRDYWATDRKAREFFDKAVHLAQADAITTLRVSDYNTTGVIGDDADRTKNWYSLIRCSGSSSKYGGEGGSYGIGKNAPFATSHLRAVLYSTYTSEDNHAFQGVAKLVTHELANGGKAQSVGYLGGSQGESVRARNHIPRQFRRDEQGTDIFILGFKEERTWQSELELSVLENFWPAISFGDLEVHIGDRVIAKDNLSQLLEARSGEENFTAHHYYAAFSDPSVTFDKTLRHLQEVSLYIRSGETELPKRVAMVRASGMVVWHRQSRSAIPFCGVFLCRNAEGNRLLRDMEPPRHDIWDPDFPEKGANRRIETEFVNFIRESVKQLTVKDDMEIIPIPELSRFLPDDENAEEAFGTSASDEQPPVEGFPAKPPAPKPKKPIPVQKMPQRKPMQPDGQSPQPEGQGDTEEGSAETGGTRGGPAGGQSNNVDGGPGSGGAAGDGSSTPTSGAHGGANSKPAIPVRLRAYPKDGFASTYVVVIHPLHEGQREAVVTLFAVGDDTKEPLRIRTARLADGTGVPVEPFGRIGPLTFPESGSIGLEVELGESRKIAMEASAHEA